MAHPSAEALHHGPFAFSLHTSDEGCISIALGRYT